MHDALMRSLVLRHVRLEKKSTTGRTMSLTHDTPKHTLPRVLLLGRFGSEPDLCKF